MEVRHLLPCTSSIASPRGNADDWKTCTVTTTQRTPPPGAALASPPSQDATAAASLPRRMDVASLRAEFPVLERLAYLNAGTDGPVPAAAVAGGARGARARRRRTGGTGRTSRRAGRWAASCVRCTRACSACAVEDVALQTSTSAGIGAVLAGHGPRAGRRDRDVRQRAPGADRAADRGARPRREVRAVPLRDVADAVGARTTLVACSHVSWVTGEFAPAALGGAGRAGRARRRAGRRRRPARHRARWAARPTRRPARSGCAAPTGPGCCTSRRRSASACARSPPAYLSFEDIAREALHPTRAATTRRRCRARRSRSRSPPPA